MGKVFDGEVFRDQLEQLREALQQKREALLRSGAMLLIDNARPHTAKETKAKILELGFETLAHPPYSPDLAPTDYHLFGSLQHFLEEQSFSDMDEVEEALT